jgi:hypothetical protein
VVADRCIVTGGVDARAESLTGARRRIRPWLDAKQATHGIYIEIVVLAVILALEGKPTSDVEIVATVFGALVAVGLAGLLRGLHRLDARAGTPAEARGAPLDAGAHRCQPARGRSAGPRCHARRARPDAPRHELRAAKSSFSCSACSA